MLVLETPPPTDRCFSLVCYSPIQPGFSLPAPPAVHVQLPKVSTRMHIEPPQLANE
jgi:hypothetical protein